MSVNTKRPKNTSAEMLYQKKRDTFLSLNNLRNNSDRSSQKLYQYEESQGINP